MEALAPAESEVRQPFAALPWVVQHPNTLFLTDSALYRRVFPRPGARRLETLYRAARAVTGLLMDGATPVGGAWNYDAQHRRPWKGTPSGRPTTSSHIACGGLDRSRTRWPWTRQTCSIPGSRPCSISGCSIRSCSAGAPKRHIATKRRRWRRRRTSFARSWAGASSCGTSTRRTARSTRRPTRWRATLPLPAWYWGAPSGLHCLDTTVAQVLDAGYSHHITRLMVLANVATLLGVDPHALNRWFWLAYLDAYEWVVTPNVAGMATYADGGRLGSKPYVSSGNYIQRMGPSLCAECRYDLQQTAGETACPLNHLYWDFLERHRARLARNVRMSVPLAALRRLSPEVIADHRAQAERWREAASRGSAPQHIGSVPAAGRGRTDSGTVTARSRRRR